MGGIRLLALVSCAPHSLCAAVSEAAGRCGFSLVAEAPSPAPVVVVWDGVEGPAVQAWLAGRSPELRYFGVLAAAGSAQAQTLAGGCEDFVFWPAPLEEIALRLERFYTRLDRSPTDARRREMDDAFVSLHLVGRSPRFLDAMSRVRRFAETQATVLIEGATGTGKELVARAIHYWGTRRGRAFIPINCGALPDTLVEDELFGHEPGAFTDARRARRGVIEQAQGGTLFLDEVEALSAKSQVALLRFLQDQEFRPLGGQQSRQGDVRIVAASNTPLSTLVAEGRFRDDLRFRLDVLAVSLPPLVDRLDDIEPLSVRILQRLQSRYGGPPRTLAPGVVERLKQCQWPGNIRELENVLHRAFVTSETTVLTLDQPASGAGAPAAAFDVNFRRARARVIAGFEREYLTWALAQAGGNVTRAARLVGKERRSLGRLLKKHGLARASDL
jgi:DNA-binding NtrC family response regulator